jgi:hypothetical protein
MVLHMGIVHHCSISNLISNYVATYSKVSCLDNACTYSYIKLTVPSFNQQQVLLLLLFSQQSGDGL